MVWKIIKFEILGIQIRPKKQFDHMGRRNHNEPQKKN